MENKIKVSCLYSGAVNFAMQQNYVPIIRNLTVHNDSDEEMKNLKLKIRFEPNFAYEYETDIECIEPKQAVEITPVNIKLSSQFLFELTEKITGTIFFEVIRGEEKIYNHMDDIEILAYDEWGGTLIMPEVVCAFITPNHSKISEIIIKASEFLKEWTGDPSFTSYYTRNPNVVKYQMAAIYAALQKENINYNVSPASYEIIGQRVRLCDKIFEEKLANCLDLTLLYASCLEAIGLNPLVIMIKGHAFIGCWLEEESFSEAIQDDITVLTKRLADGINEICLVESTAFTRGKTINFDEAVKLGESNILDENVFELVVDVKRSRGSGIRPIPMRKNLNGTFELVEFEKRKDEEVTNAPKEIAFLPKVQNADTLKVSKQQLWERKLLDLSLRNTLLSFRITKSSVQLMINDLCKLEDALADGNDFRIMARPNDFDNALRDTKIYEIENSNNVLDTLIKNEFNSKRIRTFLDERELEYKMTSLYRQAKLSLEENGTNTLYLALGFLKWYESDLSEKPRYAPIVLIPIEIVRKVQQKGFVIRIRDEEPQMNITLLEMLRQDFGMNIGGLDPLPTDDSGVDLKLVFNIIRQAVMSKKKWDVEEFSYIGVFSFSQFVMWNDIKNRAEDLKKNKVVASLISGKREWEAQEVFLSSKQLDRNVAPLDMAVPTSADSSQLSAIYASSKGESFVLHGPPGTGKSQTITNMIANALFQGKSVLFVAEKMAALNVVQKRLENIGVGPFCLELHSNKAKKKDFLNQLEKVLQVGNIKEPENYNEKAERLHELRKNLNNVISEIHKKQEYGVSLYDSISKYEKYIDCKGNISFSQEQINNLTNEKYQNWIDELSKFKVAGIECGGALDNELREITSITYSIEIKEKLTNILDDYIKDLKELNISYKSICEKLEFDFVDEHSKIKKINELIEVINNSAYIPKNLFLNSELKLMEQIVRNICNVGRRKDELENQIISKFEDQVFKYDVQTAELEFKKANTSWFIKRLMSQGRLVKELKLYAKEPRGIGKNNIEELYKLLNEYKEKEEEISKTDIRIVEGFGALWNSTKSDWNRLEKAFDECVKLQEATAKACKDNSEENKVKDKLGKEISNLENFKNYNRELFESILRTFKDCSNAEEELSKICGIDFEELRKQGSWICLALEKSEKWHSNLDKLKEWSVYLNEKSKLISIGLNNVVVAYEEGKTLENNLEESFYCNLSFAGAINIIEKSEFIKEFQGAIFEDTIEKYKNLCKEFEDITIHELISRLSSKVPSSSANSQASSEIGILQKAIRSGGRMLSIRKVFDSIPNLLRRLCPCMLMSPISVAQYIDPSFPKFDLVIFDEASQMPTCEAIGAMARGENVIVVGDPKQLPPTSFFTSNKFDEDNYDKEDLESLLDDCLALSMPEEHLLWHYRSRHESLIAYSNFKYYDNNLFTFPSPNDLVSEVKFVQVDGYYDRGKTKHNKAESEHIVNEILRRLKDPKLRNESIGVVTFSSVQQNLIDDMLVSAFQKEPELEEINLNSKEPIFIKNIENVQGDERDVILFSIGYGPDPEGKVALNFGPINRDGGWRRLNVAISRARKKMVVYSTLKPEQIDLTRTRSEGISGLKGFLEFAKKGNSALIVKNGDAKEREAGIENIISNRIRDFGYNTKCNIGCSGYKIDIGIVNPKNKNEYILGIMCDGENYKNSGNAKDRNILQPNVLNGLGWNLYRIWIIDWLENPKKELDKIKKLVDTLINAKENEPKIQEESIEDSKRNTLAKSADDEENTARNVGFKYEAYKIQKEINALNYYKEKKLEIIKEGAEEFCLNENNSFIIEQIKAVINEEAPISKRQLCKRILTAWNISRLGARIDRRFEELFIMSKIKTTVSNDTKFFWRNDQEPSKYEIYRIIGDTGIKRTLDDISPQEISNAIKSILKSQISLIKGDLTREVAKTFGFVKVNDTIEKAVKNGIKEAERKNYISVAEDGERIVVGE